MVLELVEILNSTFSLLTVIIFSIVGILIIIKYFKYKNKVFIYIGVAWIIMGSAWWSSSFAFLAYLVNGIGLPLEIYLILGYPLVPFGLFLFGLALIELKYNNKKTQIALPLIAFVIIFEAYFFFFLFTNPIELGILTSPVNIDFRTIMEIFLIIALISVVIMGLLIARESFKSDSKEVKLKGKFLMIAFISLLIGAAMDTILPITFITFPIIRLILITSAIEFYFGYFLPFWLKSVLLKNDNSENKARI
jgi:hypothetical protein